METKIIKEKQDLTFLKWSKIRHSSGTGGSFLKAYSEFGGTKFYYKLSNYDNLKGVTGHESVNEVIVDRLLTLLGIEHLHYQLVFADIIVDDKKMGTFVCVSENYRSASEDKIAIDTYYDALHFEQENPLDFSIRMGWENYIYELLVTDFLILNRDRHGANVEILRDKKSKSIRLAPLFDHGLSLLCRCETEDDIDKFDILADLKIQCFFGSNSASSNLALIPSDKRPALNPLKESDKKYILDGLDGIISKKLQNKIWDMIWERWCYYENFCNSR